MLTPNEAYQYDPTFRRVVELMQAYLSEYEITPAELRQAAILAATMHADRCIKPLYIAKPKSWEGMQVFIDEAKDIPPAMFGVPVTDAELNRTVSGSMFNTTGPNFTEQDRQAGLDKFKCICGLSEHPNRTKHTHTCNDSNWVFYHPKFTPIPLEHCHTFRATGKGFAACADCGMSDVYYNWAYNKKS
jgi:hypothetical protein